MNVTKLHPSAIDDAKEFLERHPDTAEYILITFNEAGQVAWSFNATVRSIGHAVMIMQAEAQEALK